MNILDIVLVVVLLISLVTDIKERKILNIVLFPAMLIAFVYWFFTQGFNGLWSSLAGFGLGLVLLLIPYLMGGMGAGDVKLMATVGAIKGSTFVFYAFLYTAIVGGIIALIILIWQQKWHRRVKDVILWLWLKRKGIDYPMIWPKKEGAILYPYGVAIVLGSFITVGLRGW